MPDVLIMNSVPLNPPSPTSSATYIDCPSPSYKAQAPYHMNNLNKGKYKFPSSSPEDEPRICGTLPSTGMLSEINSDISPAIFMAQSQAILNDPDIPMDIIKEAIAAQYATCEKHRTRLMSKLWEVEEINRWKRFTKRTVAALREEHRLAQSGLQVWLDVAEKQISRDSASTAKSYRKEQETFGSAQMELDNLEELAVSRGITDVDFAQEDGALDEDSDDDSTMTDGDDLGEY